jgi:AcrR family transcriptional regulator
MTAERPRAHAPPEARRAQILGAALRCFGAKGYHEATMDDLAAAAGLSKGSLYWHFDGKEAVFLALLDAFADEVLAGFERLARGGAPVLAGLRDQGEHALERLGEALALGRAWIDFLALPPARARFAAVYTRSRRLTAEALRRGVGSGELRAFDVEAVAAGFVALVEGLLLQAFVDPAFPARRHWRGCFDALATGLAT